jgi:hypothetical protein
VKKSFFAQAYPKQLTFYTHAENCSKTSKNLAAKSFPQNKHRLLLLSPFK